jgi:CO dehydrogenase/acetyl-CoA synthase beta subunit
MAKGIRSKVKRANRSSIRKSVTAPLSTKRQEQMATALQAQIASRTGNSINSLKALLSTKGVAAKTGVTMELEGDEEEEEEEDAVQAVSNLLTKGFKKPKYAGTKAKVNPGKPLVWFK